MTSTVHCNRVVPRVTASHSEQLVFRARHTCSSVISGFFPPHPLGLIGHEGHGHQAEHQVAEETDIVATLIMAKPDFAFANPKHVFDVPTPKGHTQELLQGGPCRSIGYKIFHLACRYVAGHDQPIRPCRRAPVAQRVYWSSFDFPNLRPERLTRQTHASPRLPAKNRTVTNQVVRTLARITLNGLTGVTARRHTTKGTGHFADIAQSPAAVQIVQKLRFAAVMFVKSQPVQMDALRGRTFHLLQGDAPFRPIHHVIGNARLLAAVSVFGPGFGQKQVRINQGFIRAARHTQVHRDDTVILLARGTAPLALHARRLRSFLGRATLVNDANRAEVIRRLLRQSTADILLQQVTDLVLPPGMVFEKLLQGANGYATCQSNGFDTLAWQVRQQAPAIRAQMIKGARIATTKQELLYETTKRGPQTLNLLGCHP